MILVIISIVILSAYITAVCIKTKGIPYSISATYYTIAHKMAFGWCMIIPAMLLFTVIWDLSPTFITKLLAILACAGLVGVGLAPDFRDNWINKVHCTSATVTLLASQLWVACMSAWQLLIPLWGLFILYTLIYMYNRPASSLYVRFVSSRPMFWCEIASLISFITTIIIKL